MIKLTVVTTTYNQEKFIRNALDGFVNQITNFSFQVIISDDCSTDGTRSILKEYAEKYPNIIKPIFNKKNLGAMDNFVSTLSKAKTEYVALCDGDDFWTDNNKLQKQVDFLDNNLDYSICFHQTKIFFEDKSKKEEVYPTSVKEETSLDDLLKECYIPANTVVYRWRFSKGNFLNFFPNDVVPGDYFVHLLHAEKGKIHFINEVMSSYRRHQGGMWWETSQTDQQTQFHIKYGVKYINFFEAIEKHFNLNDNFYAIQKNYLMRTTIKAYLENNMYEELVILSKIHQDLYDLHIKDFSYKPVYENLSKPKKIIYLFVIDKKLLFKKIKNNIKKHFIRKV